MRNITPWILLSLLGAVGCGSEESAPANSSAGKGGTSAGTGGGSGTGGGGGTGGGTGGSAGSTGGSAGKGGGTGTGGSSGASGTGGSAGSGGGAGCIASRYPGDVGIASDPDVVFADDFESYAQASELLNKWDNYFQASRTRIVTDAANVWGGQKSLEFTLPQSSTEVGNVAQKILNPELDVLYLRFHSKFESTFDVSGSSHNGGGISAHYNVGNMATPGIPANGTNKYLIEFESWRGQASEPNPGLLNIYIYHPEQRSNYGDHFFPSGMVLPNTSIPHNFGPTFVSRPDVNPELGRWYAFEVLLKANTVGQRDGRVTLWLDGQVIGDFPNLRFRDVATLTIDRFNVGIHAGSNPRGQTRKWYDNIVAAKSCIGPMVRP